jgi:hypothetical protein
VAVDARRQGWDERHRAGTVEIHHRYRIVGPDGAGPIEGEVMVTSPGAGVDHMGQRQASGSAA